ncbi:glycoside hydrolase family 104 protein [Candidatus Gracilibacteria bacterium]|nr:glycoside hydrolase family 104 protein [Candidatus Gracilibacteria bacterium]OIO76033.1 MAG: hypothetical protein AUJ87_03625 [Candidatus Gracilibacteria bacterium CG1_02_38_174]PIQ41532.1 MAG: hypothetical protein COW06_02665 [Candidatus Gracilibacteria bacterium CG12_big_fil_rev_8_21_14_0_65_38_15]PIZ01744.1 MAG: hypothetical protein COY60_01980 [Candidatus Gracilibacteria bacterium CG_4_10_14_0_8_um_filter_38_28]
MSSLLLAHSNIESLTESKPSLIKDCMNCIKRFSGRVSLVLGLTVASSPGLAATSLPDAFQYDQKASVLKNPGENQISGKDIILPKKTPIRSKQKAVNISSVSENITSELRTAKAKKGDSVGSFMLKNFGTKEGWEGRLVNIKTGDIVLNSYKDLKAGETYMLARSIDEMVSFISLFKKTGKVTKTSVSKPQKLSKPVKSLHIEKTIKTKKPSKPKLSKQPKLTYSSFAAPQKTFFSIARKTGIPESHILDVLALAATLGHQESTTNYNVKGEIIKSKYSEHTGTCANGRYQIMEKNWTKWSTDYFGKKLSPTPENQDKVAFSEISSRYLHYYNKGLDISTIVEEVGKDWYGRGLPSKAGHPTPTQYATKIVQTFYKISKDFTPEFSVVASNTITIPKATSTKIALAKKASPQKNTPKPTVIAANESHFDKENNKDYTTDFIFDGKQVVSLRKGSSEDKLIGKIYKEKMFQSLKNDPNFNSLSNKFEKFTKASDFVKYYRDNIRHFEEKGWDTTKLRKLFSELGKDISRTTQQAKNDSGYELKKAA